MTTKVEKSIQVDVPVTTAYNQWTQFEDFPHFMGGVKEVRQLDDRRLHWVAEIAGVRREWEAAIVEQVPDQKVAWAATGGATNAGAVRFQPAGPASTPTRVVPSPICAPRSAPGRGHTPALHTRSERHRLRLGAPADQDRRTRRSAPRRPAEPAPVPGAESGRWRSRGWIDSRRRS